ncbi:hypothetical protein J4221_02880 [Candidatus Pacearchaeota archaeon]|nr:hypothetical protein [Candidatus Pacearchaeota archaeon]
MPKKKKRGILKNKRGQVEPLETTKKSRWWIWILIILILVVVGIGIYFWLGGSGGGLGGGIPQPPALPE